MDKCIELYSAALPDTWLSPRQVVSRLKKEFPIVDVDTNVGFYRERYRLKDKLRKLESLNAPEAILADYRRKCDKPQRDVRQATVYDVESTIALFDVTITPEEVRVYHIELNGKQVERVATTLGYSARALDLAEWDERKSADEQRHWQKILNTKDRLEERRSELEGVRAIFWREGKYSLVELHELELSNRRFNATLSLIPTPGLFNDLGKYDISWRWDKLSFERDFLTCGEYVAEKLFFGSYVEVVLDYCNGSPQGQYSARGNREIGDLIAPRTNKQFPTERVRYPSFWENADGSTVGKINKLWLKGSDVRAFFPELIEMLESQDRAKCISALELIARMGPIADATLQSITALDRHEGIFRYVVASLESLGAVKQLANFLSFDNEGFRRSVPLALKRIFLLVNQPAPPYVVQALIDLLKDNRYRGTTVDALAHLAPQSIPSLVRATGNRDHRVRTRSLRTLRIIAETGRVGDYRHLIAQSCADLLGSISVASERKTYSVSDKACVEEIVELLNRVGASANTGTEQLRQIFLNSSEDVELRLSCGVTLGSLANDENISQYFLEKKSRRQFELDEFWFTFADIFDRGSLDTKKSVLKSIANIGPRARVLSTMIYRALADESLALRLPAAMAAYRVLDEPGELINFLQQVTARGPSADDEISQWGNALSVLLKLSSGSAITDSRFRPIVKNIISSLHYLDENNKVQAVKVLGRFHELNDDVIPALADLLGSSSKITIESLKAFSSMAQRALSASKMIKRCLCSDEPDVRAVAAFTLWRVLGDSEWPVSILTEILTMAKVHGKSRRQALVLLEQMGSVARAAVPDLLQLIRKESGTTRHAALQALLKIECKAVLEFLPKNFE